MSQIVNTHRLPRLRVKQSHGFYRHLGLNIVPLRGQVLLTKHKFLLFLHYVFYLQNRINEVQR